MYIRFSALLPVTALAAAAAATPTVLEARQSTSKCNTGSIECCGSTYDQYFYEVTYLFGLLGLPSVQGLVGLTCTPFSTGTGAMCTQQPVCCSGNIFNGLINVGCSPINVNN